MGVVGPPPSRASERKRRPQTAGAAAEGAWSTVRQRNGRGKRKKHRQ
eukprot:NODE_6812_length_274_cov_279.093333_g6200_i0.p2 GENE.NODE_6812_length_274_cov_279.093333_g6200_i0~~NODE_6812_length_274_cov_279.093333_g6200_i0.p2  ORF type:complete len:57 (-),score=30.38 NODE_6812_length_274_cov_279.093333_g6200_i0:103-243(-)